MRLPRISGLVSAAALFVIVGAACAPAVPQTTTNTGAGQAPAAQPVDFKLRVGISTLQATLDPHAAIGNNPRRYGLYECLINQDENGKLIPGLAASWTNLNPTTWQFKLAQGRKFHSGNPVTAEDIKYSFDRATNPDLKLGILTRVGTITKTDIVDPQTINFTTNGPDGLFLKRVAVVVIVEKAHVEKVGAAGFATQAMGTGPYMQKEFIPNDRLVLVPNPHSPVKPNASELTVRSIPEASARVAGLRTGELDLIVGVPIDQPDSLKSAGFNIVNFNQGSSYGAFIFATLPDTPTQNKLVRQALNYAVDKESIAKNIYKGYTQPSSQIVQPTTIGFNPNLKPYPYDPAKAKQLLAQAGYPNGINIKLDVTLGIFEAQALFLTVQSNWREAGINAEMNASADSAFLLDRWYARIARPHVFTASLLNSPAMDADFAINWFRGGLTDPERRLNNPEFDAAYSASLTELDEKKRTELLQKAVAVLHEDAAYLYLVDGFNLWAHSPNITDVKVRGDQEPAFEIIKKK